ncbi:ATP-binding protein [Actinomadura rudentiformis]|uniref:ATP-binding protein n=1 Tax=Actinomadura rudentiformis TaxID=359158 RepID=A0A6H9YUK2_9ACTN|nr:ATP-binding protein [Actinomadura rudentiformis]KAB2343444.1 ATP-binding protein [Actinomadura rudentiformis]
MSESPVSLEDLTGRFPRWLIWHGRSTGLWSALPPRELPKPRLLQSASLDGLAALISHALGRPLPATPTPSASWCLEEESWPVRAARRAVADALDAWHLERWRDDALTVTSELVTNAVSHSRPPIALTLAVMPGPQPRLLIEVTDGSPDLPVPRSPGDHGGFGLTIANSYAEVTVVPHGHGKAVRAVLDWPDQRLPPAPGSGDANADQ